MKYEEMSDFEINKLVAFAIDDDGDIESVTKRESKLKCIGNQALVKIKGIVGAEHFNPCNNPSDAWPIIVENGIGITPHGRRWMANNFNPSNVGDFNVQTMHYDKNPLRAAMICFLKMKDAEK